jgi:alanine racemase
MSNSEIFLVIKANAYGHGAKELASYAYKEHHIRYFAVATLEEALEIRDALENNVEILVLGFVDPLFVEVASNKNIILTVFDKDIAIKYSENLHDNLKLKVAIKIDSGMNRLGFKSPEIVQKCLNDIRNFDVFCLMSHLSSADNDKAFTLSQISLFNEYIKLLGSNYHTSLFNSAAICNFNNTYTFTRPGIMTYGYVNAKSQVKLKHVMYLYTKIVHINNVKANEKIGYDGSFVAPHDMKVGVLPIGYGDGYRRELSNRGYVYIDKFKCSIIGNICMDMLMIDITSLPEKYVDYDVEILGDNIDAKKLGEMCNTIPYEIMTNFSSRIKRIYI